MPMAADQRRKRLNGASMVLYGSSEQHKTKRNNLGLVQNDLTMKSHVSVEWVGKRQRVVAKREQIGISWRQMRPFANFNPNGHKILADVLAMPQEIFDLDNLSELLSYEVWYTYLSENERKLLMQFLPSDFEPDQLVQELLSGNNFQFGNPFLKWGASLCSGDLHPDMIFNQERYLKSEKKAYYSQLHNYHNDMIGFLIKLKERWESCKDPEKEIVQKIWSSKNDVEEIIPSKLIEFRVNDHGGHVTVTSDSCSWGAEEKAYGDNQISSMGQGDKVQRRLLDKGFGKVKPSNLMVSSDDILNVGARPNRVDKLHKNIHSSDADKYMSCFKISKKQHELVKNMKLSCKSIQSGTLNRVLGNLDNIHVQPYKVFIKEEQEKLHEHWLQLVNKDLPAAYVNWTHSQIQKHIVINSLVVEMNDKLKPLAEDENIVTSGVQLPDQDEDGGLNDQSSLEDDGDSIARSPENQSLHNSHSVDDEPNRSLHNDQSSLEDGGDSIARSSENQSLHNSHSVDDELNHSSMDSEKNIGLSKSDDASQNKTEYLRNMNTQDVPVSEVAPFSSDDHVWQAVEMPQSYYDSAMTEEYTANGLPLVNPQVNEVQQCQLISLESDLHQVETGKELLPRQSGDGPFSSYQSQDQIDLLQSFFKREGVNSYHHEQKKAGLDFQTSNNVMVGDGQFSSHFKEPFRASLALDQGQRRAREVYMPESMSANIYSDRVRYLIPKQDPLSAVNNTDWTVNAPGMVAASQSEVNTGDFIDRHWYPANHQVRGGWSGSDGGSLGSQSLGIGGNSDQSLYSILSQYSQQRSSGPYDSVRHNDQFHALRNYGVLDAGRPRTNAVLSPSSHPLEYFTGREAPSTMVPDNMAWMSLPQQNPALHDQMGKPYLRSWNR